MKKQYLLIIITLVVTFGLIISIIIFAPTGEEFDQTRESAVSKAEETLRTGVDLLRQ